MKNKRQKNVLALTIAALASTAVLVAAPAVQAASGDVLNKIKSKGEFVIGNRGDLIPFSFVGKDGKAGGYSIDFCNAIYEEVKAALHMPDLKVRHVKISGKDRITAPKSATIDVECGATTITKSRMEEINFSYSFFVSGARFMAKKSSGFHETKDLKGKKVAVAGGTTTETLLRSQSNQRMLALQIVQAQSTSEAFAMLEAGKVDAMVTEDAGLWGLSQRASDPNQYEMIGEYMSKEPYGVGHRKGDEEFTKIIDKAIVNYAKSGNAYKSYEKWFGPNAETGAKTSFPMNFWVKDMLKRPSKMPAF